MSERAKERVTHHATQGDALASIFKKHTQTHPSTRKNTRSVRDERVKLGASVVHSSTAPFCVSAKRDLGRTRAGRGQWHTDFRSAARLRLCECACVCVCVCGTYPSQCQPKGDAACEDPTPHLHLAHTATGERTKAQRLIPLRRPSCPNPFSQPGKRAIC
jgi:hypothetical protein